METKSKGRAAGKSCSLRPGRYVEVLRAQLWHLQTVRSTSVTIWVQ